MEATASFLSAIDTMEFNQSKPVIIELKSSIGELVFLLRKLKSKLSSEFGAKVVSLDQMYQAL